MSSHYLFSGVASLQSSRAAVTQSTAAAAQRVAPNAVTPDSVRRIIDAFQEYNIPHEYAERPSIDITFEEAMGEVCAVRDPLYTIMVKYHRIVLKIRYAEVKWMTAIDHYHHDLKKIPRHVTEKKFSQAELDHLMDKHSVQLLEYDAQLKDWFGQRAQENAIMVRCNDRIVAENARRCQADVRREDHDRRGHTRWVRGPNGWQLDQGHRATEHDEWVTEYILWLLTYDRFSRQRRRNLNEYKELFRRQAEFSRSIGNYQVARFFEEVEQLNDVAGDSVEKSGDHTSTSTGTSTLKVKNKTLPDRQGHVAAGRGEGRGQAKARNLVAVRRQRRHTL